MSLVGTWRQKFQKYSKREKVFLFLIFVLAIVSFGFLVRVLMDSNESDVCLTKECIVAANHILSTVDESVDPCENFYNFICGNYFKTVIAHDEVTPFSVLDNAMDFKIKQIIAEDRSDEKNLTRSFRNQRTFYRACMNTTAMDEDQDETFLEDLKYVIGEWPLSQGYVLDLFWPEVMLRAREKGMDYGWFFNISTSVNNETTKVLIELSPPKKHEIKWNGQNIQKFLLIAKYWGNEIVSWELLGNLSKEFRKTMEFNKNLSIIIDKAHNTAAYKEKNSTKLITKVSKLRDLNYTNIQWLQFLQNFTGLESLDENDEIIFRMNGDEYFKDLYYLMQKTEKKFWVNFVAVVQIIKDCHYLSSNLQMLCADLIPTSFFDPRSKFCSMEAQLKFKSVAETYQIRKTITHNIVKDITEMIEPLKEEMAVTIKRTAWMDASAKEIALKHLRNITLAVGEIEIVFNETLFEQLFDYVQGEIYSKNVVRIKHNLDRQLWNYNFKKVKEPFNSLRETFLENFQFELSAFYEDDYNLIRILAPMLQLPIYDIKGPKYLNYGGLGATIGHELTHAFAPVNIMLGYMIDYGFNFTDHWINQTNKNYDSATNCVIEEYVKYTNENGIKLTHKTEALEENIADFTGLNLAYLAYQNWTYYNGEERKLPGIKFTPNQLFWILSSSTIFCQGTNLEPEDWKYGRDFMHGIDSFRVYGPIRNSPYFASDFGCPMGSKMNPEEKCQVFV